MAPLKNSPLVQSKSPVLLTAQFRDCHGRSETVGAYVPCSNDLYLLHGGSGKFLSSNCHQFEHFGMRSCYRLQDHRTALRHVRLLLNITNAVLNKHLTLKNLMLMMKPGVWPLINGTTYHPKTHLVSCPYMQKGGFGNLCVHGGGWIICQPHNCTECKTWSYSWFSSC